MRLVDWKERWWADRSAASRACCRQRSGDARRVPRCRSPPEHTIAREAAGELRVLRAEVSRDDDGPREAAEVELGEADQQRLGERRVAHEDEHALLRPARVAQRARRSARCSAGRRVRCQRSPAILVALVTMLAPTRKITSARAARGSTSSTRRTTSAARDEREGEQLDVQPLGVAEVEEVDHRQHAERGEERPPYAQPVHQGHGDERQQPHAGNKSRGGPERRSPRCGRRRQRE